MLTCRCPEWRNSVMLLHNGARKAKRSYYSLTTRRYVPRLLDLRNRIMNAFHGLLRSLWTVPTSQILIFYLCDFQIS
jgi:hypothetical protein